MASRGSLLPAGRSPLRAQLSRFQQPSISSAASAHLRHLHQVAAWASLLVPPLGAFLGSRLASTSEFLGCPPPSSPHFICQRCESILQVGRNCSVRVRTRKLRKRVTETKRVSAPINSFTYSCQHCAFESVISGTSKAYVKSKLSEVAARHQLSEPYQSLNVCMAEKVTQPIKMSSSESLCSQTCLRESPGSTIKRTKRKGWLSLKQLSASSADLSPAGSRPVHSPKSVKFPLLPQLGRMGSARVLPTVSQVDLKSLIPASRIEGELLSRVTSIKTMSELEPSEGDIDSEKMASFKVRNADLSKLEQSIAFTAHMVQSSGDTISNCVPQLEASDSLGVLATSLRSDAEQSDAPGITMNVEDKGLQQKLSIHHSDADAAMQSTVLASVSTCTVQDTISTFEARCNLSGAVSQTDLAIVAPTVQDTISTFEAQCNLSGAVSRTDLAIVAPTSSIQDSVKPVVDASVPLNGLDYFDDKALDLPVSDKEVTSNKNVGVNSSIVNAIRSKKRQRDEDNNWCKVPRKQENCKPDADRLRMGEFDKKETSGIYMPSSMMLVGLSGSTRKNINTQTVAHERKVKSRTKKKPLFRRVGRRWFTICKSSRTLKWRII